MVQIFGDVFDIAKMNFVAETEQYLYKTFLFKNNLKRKLLYSADITYSVKRNYD